MVEAESRQPELEPDPRRDDPPARLARYLDEAGVDHEFVAPGVPTPTVASAAAALGVSESAILKTLVFVSPGGTCVAAVASGPAPVDRRKVATALGVGKLTFASTDTVRQVTGYPAGGVAPVGHAQPLRVVVDPAVLNLPVAWGGGGHERLLLRVLPADIVRLTGAVVTDIRADAG